MASASNGLVGVGGLRHGEVGLVPVEGEGLVTTVAAEAGLNAINEFLFVEGKQFTSGNLPGTFEGTGGGERPA